MIGLFIIPESNHDPDPPPPPPGLGLVRPGLLFTDQNNRNTDKVFS